ncbi:MAG TPA: acyltransferase [Nevskiaceae bacterium]|nr:acyltransferase [Nevskiaceae bacterium]
MSAGRPPLVPRGRVEDLDTLRGVGAVIIVWTHIRHDEVFWSWMLMEMFFVMSAALLTTVIWGRLGSLAGVLGFYRRRAERIWPPYFLALAGIVVLSLLLSRIGLWSTDHLALLWRYLSFSQYSELMFTDQPAYPYWYFAVHLWSLAVEEQFYLLLPAGLIVVSRLSPRQRLLFGLALLLLATLLRNRGTDYYALTAHLDAFVYGVAIAVALATLPGLQRDRLRQIAAWAMRLGGVLVAVYIGGGYLEYLQGADPFVYRPWAGSGAALFWAGAVAWLTLHAGDPSLFWLRSRLTGYLGRISYSLYLTHYPLIAVLPRLADWAERRWSLAPIPVPLVYAVAVLLSLVSAHLLYVLVDRRLQALGARRASPPALPSAAGGGG